MNKPKSLDQQGVVSFITVIFLAGILALITTGFVKTMISNQRQSLDLQLSTQAFYAAESAVNDTMHAINDPTASVEYNANNCTSTIPTVNGGDGSGNMLNSSANIKYTCLLVNNKVPYISIDSSISTDGKTYPVTNADGSGPITSIVLSWGESDEVATRTDASLPPSLTWNPAAGSPNPPVLRASFFYPPPNDFSRNSLMTYQRTLFLIPNKTGVGAVSAANNNDGAVTRIECSSTFALPLVPADSSKKCQATVSVDFLPVGVSTYYIRVVPIYGQTSIRIDGQAGGSNKNFAGAQYSIDATGRANDVYKRYEFRKSVQQTTYNFPDSALKTYNSICKQFVVWPISGVPVGGSKDESAPDCSSL